MTVFDVPLESAWLGPVLWAALYVSDYMLTLAGARRYQAQANIVFEGSYEITPVFQADVNALRKVSPRFVFALVASTTYVWFVQRIAGPSTGYLAVYVGVLGAMVLLEATVHIRHLRNWFLFSRGAGLMQGRVVYPRGLLLRMSAFEFVLFAALYCGLFLVTMSKFILGGTLACAALSFNHYRLARRHDAAALKAA